MSAKRSRMEPEDIKPGDWKLDFIANPPLAVVFFELQPQHAEGEGFLFSVTKESGYPTKVYIPDANNRGISRADWRRHLAVELNLWLNAHPTSGEDPFLASIRNGLLEAQLIRYLMPAARKLVEEACAAGFDSKADPIAPAGHLYQDYNEFGGIGVYFEYTPLAEAYNTLKKRINRAPRNIDKSAAQVLASMD